MADLLTWWTVVAAVAIYGISVLLYRLNFHPLSHFPGPKWTAITRYYEAYFDLVQNGQYTFKIAELHKRYGPIIRISPYELHVNDPTFLDVLYRQDAHYDKHDFAYDAWANKGASVFTIDHKLHRTRRQPMNPYFSKAKVVARQDLILRHLDKLCHRLSNFAETGETFDLGAATAALARDVANDFVLGKSYDSLGHADFDVAMLDLSQGAGLIWRVSKFFRFVGPMMQGLPVSWMVKIASKSAKPFFRNIMEVQDYTKILMTEATSTSSDSKHSRTLVHEIMDSKLPPSEKKFTRIYQDTFTVTGAGFETTASVLRMIMFHVYTNPPILQRLRTELITASTTQNISLDVRVLEQLPYLTAVLMEGLRHSPALGTRMARISRNADMSYDKWRIPAGTAVGMTMILIHMDENLYPEPKRFNPDRWLEGGVVKKPEYGFAPFSKGTRSCIGMHLAWAELYVTVARIVSRFDFQFESARAEDFEFVSDQFSLGTSSWGHLEATITFCQY